MRAEIIAIDLLAPAQQTNHETVMRLAEGLSGYGLEIGSLTHVGASDRDIEDAVRQALGRSHLVVITGGTTGRTGGGPPAASARGTEDLAKKTLSKLLDKRLILQPELLARIEESYRARNIEPPPGHDRSALLPHGARPVTDSSGAPAGFILEHSGRYVLYAHSLKDDVTELVPEEALSRLSRGGRPRTWELTRVIRSFGVEESRLSEILKGFSGKEASVSFYPSVEGVDIRVAARSELRDRAAAMLDEKCAEAARLVGDYCYASRSEGMEEVVAGLLTAKKLTIATAESCTGGLIAKRLTDVAGSSAYMERGAVCYSNLSKVELVGVPDKVLTEHGAVSREAAEEMAQGIRWNAKTDLGLSVTGIAGPSGGTPAKPVGLVYIGLATKDGVTVKGYNFPGNRASVRFAASQRALDMVRRYLLS